jgi:IS66 C-terminal element
MHVRVAWGWKSFSRTPCRIGFTWTELGAKHVGIVQSLLTTCRLHEINAYDYLVDVLQRVGQHPAARVAELDVENTLAIHANVLE